jgi:UDP-N-acetylglucosamine acyltransferase
MAIHPTAIVSPRAEISPDCVIGPYCVIGPGVTLGSGCILAHHASLEGPSRFGDRNHFGPFTVIGHRTQDLKYTDEPTFLEAGSDNHFREFCTVHRATGPGETTVIGSHNHFLAYTHVAHNCIVGDHTIFSNNATLGGHVTIEDHAVIGGLAAVHQFCRVGRHSMIGGCAKIVQDVPPFFIADGNPASVRAINQIGLQRRGFCEERLNVLRRALRLLYDEKLNTSQAVDRLEKELGTHADVRLLVDFVRGSRRGIIR